jgi:hypothetical protein
MTAAISGPGTDTSYTEDDVRRHTQRTALGAASERHAAIAATITHISSVLDPLRSLDLGDTPPTHSPITPEALP